MGKCKFILKDNASVSPLFLAKMERWKNIILITKRKKLQLHALRREL
jgi:hypothetical protein